MYKIDSKKLLRLPLYHGSPYLVEKPILLPKQSSHDFGNGFYLTSDFKQAEKWSRIVAKRNNMATSYVATFMISKKLLDALAIKSFDYASQEWLDFIKLNRKEVINKNQWDIIIGPVADGRTSYIIDQYNSNRLTVKQALKLLKPQLLSDQLVFKTDMAIGALQYQGFKKIEGGKE